MIVHVSRSRPLALHSACLDCAWTRWSFTESFGFLAHRLSSPWLTATPCPFSDSIPLLFLQNCALKAITGFGLVGLIQTQPLPCELTLGHLILTPLSALTPERATNNRPHAHSTSNSRALRTTCHLFPAGQQQEADQTRPGHCRQAGRLVSMNRCPLPSPLSLASAGSISPSPKTLTWGAAPPFRVACVSFSTHSGCSPRF